jgi:hypothetical protein
MHFATISGFINGNLAAPPVPLTCTVRALAGSLSIITPCQQGPLLLERIPQVCEVGVVGCPYQ